MKVFISWSGPQSKTIADAFRKWIPGVLQAVKPYFSPDDVVKGSRWSTEIAKELDASRVGLLIVTRENLAAPWLMFEAGALAENLEKSKVCPLLFGLEPTDITGPLVQFQGARFDVTEVKRVIKMINAELAEALPAEVLDQVFDMWWPKLDKEVQAILSTKAADVETPRPDRDLLEEVLALSRQMARDQRRSHRLDTNHPIIEDLLRRHDQLLAILAVDATGLKPELINAIRALDSPMSALLRRRRDLSSIRREQSSILRRAYAPSDEVIPEPRG